MRRFLILGLLACAAPAQAHPHMFVETGLQVVFDDQGQAIGVRVRWSYDDLTSMQILADLGFDQFCSEEPVPIYIGQPTEFHREIT